MWCVDSNLGWGGSINEVAVSVQWMQSAINGFDKPDYMCNTGFEAPVMAILVSEVSGDHWDRCLMIGMFNGWWQQWPATTMPESSGGTDFWSAFIAIFRRQQQRTTAELGLVLQLSVKEVYWKLLWGRPWFVLVEWRLESLRCFASSVLQRASSSLFSSNGFLSGCIDGTSSYAPVISRVDRDGSLAKGLHPVLLTLCLLLLLPWNNNKLHFFTPRRDVFKELWSTC